MKKTLILALGCSLSLTACMVGSPPSGFPVNSAVSSMAALNPDTAAVASVDRFQDSFGKLFKRSGPVFDPVNVSKVVPAPNAPIDMDKLFLVKALGPNGEKITYYSFDLSSNVPGKGWVFVDASGQPVPGQLMVIDKLPGDTGYSDFLRVTEVKVPAGYRANSLTNAADIMAAAQSGKVSMMESNRIINVVVVPQGTSAKSKFQGKSVTGFRAWHGNQVAHYLYFDAGMTVTADGKVPDSPIIVTFKNGKDPSMGFQAEADGQTHNVVATLPGQPGYSDLWIHNVQGDASKFAQIRDLASALANQSGPVGVSVNCPVVAP